MIERKYLAHFLDATFNGATANYVRLGKDLEEYNEDLSPDVETSKNILGETSVRHNGYDVSADVEPFYAEYSDALTTKLFEIANGRKTGDACKTTMVDVLMSAPGTEGGTPTVIWAYKEDVYVIPTSVGGDTSGVQIPFTIHKAGNRVSVTWNPSTNSISA